MNNQSQSEKKIDTKVFEKKTPSKVAPLPVKAKEKLPPEAPKPKEQVAPSNILEEKSINLIPTLSKEEVVIAEKKKKLNVGSIASLLILVIVSILIIGFNIVSRMSLNNEKSKLQAYETEVTKMTQKMISSNEITERVKLYNRVLGKTFSPKEVVDYINAIAAKSGTSTVSDFSLGEDLSFTLEGNATDMENVSKFWYLLSNDPKMETVTLKSVGNGVNTVRFSFKGKLVLNDFLSSTN